MEPATLALRWPLGAFEIYGRWFTAPCRWTHCVVVYETHARGLVSVLASLCLFTLLAHGLKLAQKGMESEMCRVFETGLLKSTATPATNLITSDGHQQLNPKTFASSPPTNYKYELVPRLSTHPSSGNEQGEHHEMEKDSCVQLSQDSYALLVRPPQTTVMTS